VAAEGKRVEREGATVLLERQGETESRSEHQRALEAGVGVAAEGKRVEREGATALLERKNGEGGWIDKRKAFFVGNEEW
jgi:hypothetical protein